MSEFSLRDFHYPFPVLQDEDTEEFNHLVDTAISTLSEPVSSLYFRSSFIAIEPCKRALVLSTLFPGERHSTIKELTILNDGTWRHLKFDAYLHILKDRGILKHLSVEHEWNNSEYWISGHIDALTTFAYPPLSSLGQVVLEFKGKKNTLFDELVTSERAHYLQAQIYMWASQSKWAFIIYDAKDDHRRKVYKAEYNTDIITDILEHMKTLKSYREKFLATEHSLPEMEIQSWCTSCPWREKCFFYASKGI